MTLNLNFSGVEDNSFSLLEGDYILRITDAQTKPAGSGNSTNLILKLEVEDGEGDSFLQWINIQSSTMWHVKQFFTAVMSDDDLESIDIDPEDLCGMTVGATITNDGKFNSVETWFPA